jgi:hypothetical protein
MCKNFANIDPLILENRLQTDLDLRNGRLNSLYRDDDDDVGSLSSGDSVLGSIL